MLWEAIKLANQSVRRNALRSILTLLGIVIGVGAVIAMVTIGNGTTQKVTSDLSKLGSNMLIARPERETFGPGGSGEVREVRSTLLGQMVNVAACGRCRGSGQVVEQACPTCRGEGRTERRRTLRVSVPAGIDDGHQIRLTGEGEAGPRGGTPGVPCS